MTRDSKSAISTGFRLLWRRQGVLWLIFIVNLVCGLFGTVPAVLRLRRWLAHSLAGQRLTDRFDIGMFRELVRLPNISLLRFTTPSYLFVFVFFIFMLFAAGGVLQTYREDRRLSLGEFCAASGGFLGRFVRLLLLSLVPLIAVGLVYQGLDAAADYFGDRAVADQVGIFLGLGATLVFLLLFLWVRLWFDIAKVRTVVQDERGMWRNMWRSWRITWRDLGSLYWMYLRISLLAWIVMALGLVLWVKLPPTATGAVLLVLELLMLVQIAARLWQLSSVMSWYQRHAEMVPADTADFTTPQPQEIVEPEPTPVQPDALPELPHNEPAADTPAQSSRDPEAELPLGGA